MSDYATDDAAAALLWPLSLAKAEQIALLYEQDGTVKHTAPQGSAAKNKARGSFEIPRGSLLGIGHNHPLTGNPQKDRNISRFSREDMALANSLGVPSYLAVGDSVRRYDPGGIGDRGKEVLAQIPLEEIRRLYLSEALKK